MVAKQYKNKRRSISMGLQDRLVSIFSYIIYTFFAFVCVYPFYYIFINTLSANDLSERGKVLFWIKGLHFTNYVNVLKIPNLFQSFKVSVARTAIGASLTVIIAAFLGYMFTRETLWKRKLWYRFVVATMYFNAGIIPWYITMRNLGLTNNFWGYIFPLAVSPFYVVPTFEHNGIEGFNYTVGPDGKFTLINDNALMDNLPVPEEWGGGGYQDGNNAINQWIVDAISINPNTGEPYSNQYWSTYKQATMTQMKKEWAEKFGASEPVEYMKKNNVLIVSPNVSVSIPGDTPDISVIRSQCGETLCDYTWRMIFANDDAAFEALWDEMATQMNGYGFDKLVEYDKTRFTIELEAKLEAMK